MNPLTLCGVPVKRVSSDRYLGDQVAGSLSESVALTIDKRRGLAEHSGYEIRTIIDDCRSEVTGGLTTGLLLWEMSVIPMLMNNAECWLQMNDSTLKLLNSIQNNFLKCLMAVGQGCPTPSLYWSTGTLLMVNRILQKKCLFVHHLATLPPDSLAREVFELQNHFHLPSLMDECNSFIETFCHQKIENFTKNQWKKMVKRKIVEKNRQDLLDQMKGYQKIDYSTHENEPFKIQQYLQQMKLSQARLKFKIDCFMTPTVKLNFLNNDQFRRENYTCWDCSNIDSQAHVKICKEYEEFRRGKNLDCDTDLVRYFQQVIGKRQATLGLVGQNDVQVGQTD